MTIRIQIHGEFLPVRLVHIQDATWSPGEEGWTTIPGGDGPNSVRLLADDGASYTMYRPRAEYIAAAVNAVAGNPDLDAFIRDMASALRECADDNEAYVNDLYPEQLRHHPAMKRRYERDMRPVNRARELLARIRMESDDK